MKDAFRPPPGGSARPRSLFGYGASQKRLGGHPEIPSDCLVPIAWETASSEPRGADGLGFLSGERRGEIRERTLQ